MLQTDRGKEFVGSILQKFFKENNTIFRVVTNPDVKVAVERFIRTTKDRVYRYLTYKNTYRHIDILQKLITVYKKTRHSTIKMAPATVTIYNAHIARKYLVERASLKQVYRKTPKYKIDDNERISRDKNRFEKGAAKSWSEEIFNIVRVLRRQNLFIYKLIDFDGENIEGFSP